MSDPFGWRVPVAQWFGTHDGDQVVVHFEEVRSTLGADLAVVHAFVVYQGVSASGELLRAMSNRLTWALARRGAGWKVVHEHTSAPVDHETAKVILQRGPG